MGSDETGVRELHEIMPERDYVADVLKVSYTGTFDFDGLYKTLYQWFKKYGYNFRESDYKEYKEGGGKRLQVKWGAKRKVSDYVKYVIEVGLQIDKMQDVAVKNRKRINGELSITITGFIEKDYEETWSRTSFLKFLREAYDAFVMGNRMQAMQDELLKDLQAFRTEVKAFLNMQKIGR